MKPIIDPNLYAAAADSFPDRSEMLKSKKIVLLLFGLQVSAGNLLQSLYQLLFCTPGSFIAYEDTNSTKVLPRFRKQ